MPPRRARLFGGGNAAPLALLLVVAACGFTPLYGEGTPAAGLAGRVAVGPIDGAAGFALRERLTERLGEAPDPDWRLDVALGFERTGAALTQQNETTRFDVIATADVTIRPAGGGAPVLADKLTAVTGYSAPVSETSSAFASLMAGRDAERRLALTLADRIALLVAVEADRLGSPAATPGPR